MKFLSTTSGRMIILIEKPSEKTKKNNKKDY